MDFKKREAELERIFYKNRMRLADLSNTAPINRQIILRCSCLAWELKQKYRAKGWPTMCLSGAMRRIWRGSEP